MQRYKKQRSNILSNVRTLQRLYGLNSGITLVLTGNICIYGIMDKGKTFYSKDNHKQFSTIALYQRNITIAFLSDLSLEIVSILSK